MIFESRQQAGWLLGKELRRREIMPEVVFGLTRGGVVVAAAMGKELEIPFRPLVVRKIGAPGQTEFALGAVAEGGAVWWDEAAVRQLGLSEEWRWEQVERKRREVVEYQGKLKVKSSKFKIKGLSRVVITDDGAATGMTMMAALSAAKTQLSGATAGGLEVIVALPVASTEAAEKFRQTATLQVKQMGGRVDQVVILREDRYLRAVGQYYRDFGQVSWGEVRRLLQLNG